MKSVLKQDFSPPCLNCQDRTMTCHDKGQCEKWESFSNSRKKVYEQRLIRQAAMQEEGRRLPHRYTAF